MKNPAGYMVFRVSARNDKYVAVVQASVLPQTLKAT
jgi:hypothetical protein